MSEDKTSALAELLALPLPRLLDEALAVRRRHFADDLDCAAPSAKRYDNGSFRNHPHTFVEVSVTGKECALRCEHCQGRLLEAMVPARSPGELRQIGESLWRKGCHGILVSGGAGSDGQVAFGRWIDTLAHLKGLGLKIIVHCGLVDRSGARGLKLAGVDQVLLDVIGDAETSREIYHLDRQPADYRRALETLKEEGLSLAPHVVIGLHRGRVRGEYEAIRRVAEVGVDRLVLVVLTPLPGTPMEFVPPPVSEEIARVLATARLLNPHTPISLGCARPAGPLKFEIERSSIQAGINAIAYPTEQALSYGRDRGLRIRFHELCCTMDPNDCA